ncbi:MAG: periplasmic heavy metal sensor [Pseudomonadota bacterium]
MSDGRDRAGRDGGGPGDGHGGSRAPGRLGAWRWLLVGSLMVNLLVAGALAGANLRSMTEEQSRMPRPDQRLMQLLPESHHPVWRERVEARASRVSEVRGKMVLVHQRIVAVLRAPEFDEVLMADAMAERRRLAEDLRLMRHGDLVAVTATLSPSEREEMASRVEAITVRWASRRANPHP